jgi:hypothetical protein
MMRSYENHVRDVPDVKFGIVGPDGREAMMQHAAEFAQGNIPLSSIRARRCRCSTARIARVHRAGAVRHGQRLRVEPAAAAHRMG